MNDIELIKTIFANKIVGIRKSDYPSHGVVRFEDVSDEILDKLMPYCGQFESVFDETQPV
jgi:hypothetical protein